MNTQNPIERLLQCIVAIALTGFSISQANAQCPENSRPVEQREAGGEIVTLCKCIDGYTKFRGGCERIERVNALRNAESVKEAMSRRQVPPFQPLWDYYQHNRDIAKGLAPDENRCAMVLSMTLGVEPRSNESSLRQLGKKDLIASIVSQIKQRGVIPEVTDAEIATRYYIRAQELADRLKDEWGRPLALEGPKAREFIADRKGIIFLQDAYPRAGALGGRSGDHIDVWNGNRAGSDSSLPFDKAKKVWFWEVH